MDLDNILEVNQFLCDFQNFFFSPTPVNIVSMCKKTCVVALPDYGNLCISYISAIFSNFFKSYSSKAGKK